MNITEKFEKLGVDNAPGQEVHHRDESLPAKGEPLPGMPVDFSHGDVDAHPPIPGALQTFVHGFYEGGKQAYTEYRGKGSIRKDLAEKLSVLTGSPIDPEKEIILTPGTQGALFLAMGVNIARGDKVAFVEPDYFANRKMVEFFEGEKVPVFMNWTKREHGSGLDLTALEKAFQEGARLFLFSNPNNPTGAVCSREEMEKIASLSRTYGVTVIADELYARQMYDGASFVHFSSLANKPENLLTIIGPSKTESMSGFRLGVAFGAPGLIRRMEKLQAIMTLRCSGYNQAVFADWLSEPEGWMAARVAVHQAIRDGLLEIFHQAGMEAASPRGGSYLFVRLPKLEVTLDQFVSLLRIQANVTVTPGTEFGPQFTDWFRINFSQDHDKAMDAAARIVRLKDRYRKEK